MSWNIIGVSTWITKIPRRWRYRLAFWLLSDLPAFVYIGRQTDQWGHSPYWTSYVVNREGNTEICVVDNLMDPEFDVVGCHRGPFRSLFRSTVIAYRWEDVP